LKRPGEEWFNAVFVKAMNHSNRR